MGKRTVAIISDVVMEYGGAERVVDCLLQTYPDSTLYTLLIDEKAREKIVKKYPKLLIVTSPFQRVFGTWVRSRYVSIVKLFSWIYWEILDLSHYDLVLSSSHSFMSKNVKRGKWAFHLSYVHTPPRYLYDEFNELGIINQFPFREIFWPWKMFLRWIDKNGAQRPDLIVANSNNVSKRILKYYNRTSIIVYPPVDAPRVSRQKTENYYVVVSRLVKQKGVEVAVSTCSQLGLNLIVVGGGDERESLEKLAGETVTFVGRCNDKKKTQIISKAKALLYTSIDEDFGIVPLEALKLGVPVIAHRSGGVLETVKDGVNGIMFSSLTVDCLSKAIARFEKMKLDRSECKRSVDKFGKAKFIEAIKKIIKENERINK